MGLQAGGGTVSGNVSPGGNYTATSQTSGQTGALNAISGGSLYDISSGGGTNVTENNTNATDTLNSIFGQAVNTASGLAVQTAQAVSTAAQNPALQAPIPPPGQGDNTWLIIGAVIGAATLIYMIWRRK